MSSHPTPTLTKEFTDAFDLLEHTRTNLFLTGKAGTGKSTFLRYFRDQTKKKYVVVAPTGIAALNVQGQTIHSLFRMPPRFVDINRIYTDKRKLFHELELLIIDEISMVRSDVFAGINVFLQKAKRNRRPFGGVQLCIIGDLFQLPPVVGKEEEAFFQQFYTSPHFFTTEAYQAGQFKVKEFQTVHRQQQGVFLTILNRLRMGKSDVRDIAALNARVAPMPSHIPTGSLVLTTTNSTADRINDHHLRSLPGLSTIFASESKGNFGLTGFRLPAPENLELKLGAQVMFIRNDPDERWVNGTLGIVVELTDQTMRVQTESGTYTVKPEKWRTIAYEFLEAESKIVEKTLGSFTQFPLMLAWAVTIHKSQGKTLGRVIIDLGRGAFADGQLYVALSRCTSLEGITLTKPISFADIQASNDVVAFMARALESEDEEVYF